MLNIVSTLMFYLTCFQVFPRYLNEIDKNIHVPHRRGASRPNIDVEMIQLEISMTTAQGTSEEIKRVFTFLW